MSGLIKDTRTVTEVLNRMKSGEECHIVHPFPEKYQKLIDSDFRKDDKNDNQIILGNMLISAVIAGDYNKCNEILENPNILEFIDKKDAQGFSSLDYSIIYNFPKITNSLINAGAKNKLKPIEELINIPKQDDGLFFNKEPEEKFNTKQFTEDEKKTSFEDAFKKAFKRNGFGENRNEKIEIKSTEEKIESPFPKSYNERHVIFLNEFVNRDVTKLLLDPVNIDESVLEHRRKMLPFGLTKSNLLTMVTNVLKEQDESIKSRVFKQITEKIYETLVFYRDIYMRMIDNNKVYIEDSPIHGKGVFALQRIKRGSIVTFYIPYLLEYVHNQDGKESYVILPVLSRRKFDENSNLEILRKGTIKISENMLLIGDDQYYSDSRFVGHMVNDACIFPEKGKITFHEYEDQITKRSNVEVVPFNVDRRFICLIANRDIDVNEEILVPYGCNYWDDKVSISD